MLGDTTLSQLKEEISQIEYDKYIKNLIYDEESSRSDIAIYEAPNPFIQNWVKTKYSEKIAYIFEILTGTKPDVEIRVKNSKKREQKRSQLFEYKQPKSTNLNPTYTFESFVIGPSNQLAFEVSQSASKNQGKAFNPLMLYGTTGLGKTHLLNAIGNSAISSLKSVIYITSEQFLNDWQFHIRNQTMDRFREKYRACDYLLIDDVQFFGGKERIQEEFFHTFNELHSKNKQIVLTSDKAPKKIAGLEDRLKSRFEWGMVVDIQPPEIETKIGIIKKKCEFDGIYLDKEIIEYIATNMDNNIREIEGIIIKLNAFANLMNQEITFEFARNILKEQIKEKKENITIENIIKAVSKELNIKPTEIKSKSRSPQIANARRVVIYLARVLTPNSMPAIAQYFGMKDHSSVSKAMKKVEEMINCSADFKLQIDELKNRIGEDNS